MKPIFLILSIFLLSSSNASANTLMVLDYRDFRSTLESTSELSREIERSIISKVVQTTDRACFGKLKPRVIDYASGSFTTVGSEQTAYLVDLGDSCHPRGRGTIRLAVFSGNRLITYSNVAGTHLIKQKIDIDQDGRNELVLDTGWLGQGYFAVSAWLVKIKPEGIVTMKTFSNVYENNFLAHTSEGVYRLSQRAITVSVTKDRGELKFQRNNYYATNCKQTGNGKWNFVCEPYQLILRGEPKGSNSCYHWLLCLTFSYQMEKPDIAFPVPPLNNNQWINKAKQIWNNGFGELCPKSDVYYKPSDSCFIRADERLREWLNKEATSCTEIPGLSATGKTLCQQAASNISKAVSSYLGSI